MWRGKVWYVYSRYFKKLLSFPPYLKLFVDEGLDVLLDVCLGISLTTVWWGRGLRQGRGEDAALWCSDIRVISSKEQTCHPILIDWIMEPASGKSSSGPVKNCSCHCAVTKCWSIQSQITGRCNRCLIISIIHFVAADTWHRQVPGLSDARYKLHLYLIG